MQVDGDVVIQNLHFENCLGYRPLIYIKTQSADWIMLNAVQILDDHEDAVGIYIAPENNGFNIELHNSFLSTEGIGFYLSDFLSVQDNDQANVLISNTAFLASCLKLETYDVACVIKNGCKCSSILLFKGNNKLGSATLRDIQISKSTSSSVVEATMFTIIYIEGTCVFHHNAGSLIFNTEHSCHKKCKCNHFKNRASKSNGHAGIILRVYRSTWWT